MIENSGNSVYEAVTQESHDFTKRNLGRQSTAQFGCFLWPY